MRLLAGMAMGGAMMVMMTATAPVGFTADEPTASSGDPRVVAALKAAGLPYTLDKGDFLL